MRPDSMDLVLFTRFHIFALCLLGLTSAETAFRDHQQGTVHIIILFDFIVTDLFPYCDIIS